MKKLDNKGWGLAEMIVFSGFILITLLIVTIMIYNFYKSYGL